MGMTANIATGKPMAASMPMIARTAKTKKAQDKMLRGHGGIWALNSTQPKIDWHINSETAGQSMLSPDCHLRKVAATGVFSAEKPQKILPVVDKWHHPARCPHAVALPAANQFWSS